DRRSLVKNLIYPVPDPEFPFLGVHFTRTVHGDVEAGPNAVLAFAREGYTLGTVKPGETLGLLGYPGFWNMARRYWKMGSYELYRSANKAAFVRSLQKLVPAIQSGDIQRGGAGVRAQAVSRNGSLVDDFRINVTEGAVHVVNAPSPAATASLAIGRHIAGLAGDTFPPQLTPPPPRGEGRVRGGLRPSHPPRPSASVPAPRHPALGFRPHALAPRRRACDRRDL